MRSVNKVVLIGNLTRVPELKTTASGQAIVTFGLATNRQWTTSNGEKRTSAEFHECVAWAKLAEICNTHLKKGMLVYVEGYLKTRSWDMDDGTRRFRTEVVLQDMIILEKRGDHDGDYMPIEEEGGMNFDAPSSKPVLKAKPAPAPAEKPAPEAAPAASEAPVVVDAPALADPTPAPAGELSVDLDDDNMF